MAPSESSMMGALARFGELEEVQALLPLVHVFTHYKLHIFAHKVTPVARPVAPPGHVWWRLAAVEAAALPAPVKKLLLELGRPSLF